MDSLFFGRLVEESARLLTGARLVSIHKPGPDLFVLGVKPGRDADLAEKRFLHFQFGKSDRRFFFSAHKPVNPKTPDAWTMKVRKHFAGRTIRALFPDVPAMRLYLGFDAPEMLRLDFDGGATVQFRPPTDLNPAPVLPPFEAAFADPEIWRREPLLSPALRGDLALLDETAARALYARLEEPGPKPVFVHKNEDAWEMRLWERVHAKRRGVRIERVDSALEAARLEGERFLYESRAKEDDQSRDALRTARIKKLERALAGIAKDFNKHAENRRVLTLAEALKAELWRLGAKSRLDRAEVRIDGIETTAPLDKRLTVVGNMEALFAKAAKAERGLVALAERRGLLAAELAALKAGGNPPQSPVGRTTPAQGGKKLPPKRGFVRYASTDGLFIYKGKNRAANHALVTDFAAPFDLWLHVRDFPGAHVVIRMERPGREIPRDTLFEAAVLAALKSDLAHRGKVEVIVADVRDVRTVKGAGLGRVAVDKIRESIMVDVDPERVAKLRKEDV